ncbi:hypothetical protein GUJ93_ZPchr0013g35665 [Zizania palustris]|uniref:COG complex component COG2 C-terminal domain-containing protein n=1 Tax=Zizania palustris TaxID=103762 RepID=A0A8J5X0Q8_ZIZPA|nr:hypothetical protein GUJ93_ZPchr0013g35665 [Zizania palustris]
MVQAPLADLRDKVAAFRAATAAALAALRAGLEQRASATAARELLELLLDTSHVVSKVEKLIKELPTAPPDSSNVQAISGNKGYSGNAITPPNVDAGIDVRETQSILLERIASEMNRLKLYTSHAQNLPFIENLEKRVQGATKLLDGSLESCFVDGLEHRDGKLVYNCLRAYAAIDNTSSAEEIFCTTVLSPLIQKIVPQNYAKAVAGVSSDDLEDDYEQIMQCVEKDCKFILEISSSANSGLHVFDFLANSVLKEVHLAVQKGKPGATSPGKPKQFLKNYKASLRFLDFLEGYCSSKPAVAKFRSEPAYADFMRLWHDIAGGLDSALTATITPVGMHENQTKPKILLLKQSIKLLESLQACWSDEVLVFSHSDKFMRLSLQLISRYTTWLSSGLATRKASDGSSNSPADAAWALSIPVEDFIYEYARNLRSLGIDAREIESFRALWQCVAPTDKQDNIQF